MTDDEPRTQEQIFHDTSAGLPAIAWGLITASLNREGKSIKEYQDEIAELTNDAARLAGGRYGQLALFGKLSDIASDLLRELAVANGQDPDAIAKDHALRAVERRERWRANRPE